MINFTLRKPVGVAGCISPWNLPLYLFTWKIAPALAAGCTMVLKPSEIAPLSAIVFSDILNEGDEVLVKCISKERDGKIRLSRKAALDEDIDNYREI